MEAVNAALPMEVLPYCALSEATASHVSVGEQLMPSRVGMCFEACGKQGKTISGTVASCVSLHM